jgi:hypothetical protein
MPRRGRSRAGHGSIPAGGCVPNGELVLALNDGGAGTTVTGRRDHLAG